MCVRKERQDQPAVQLGNSAPELAAPRLAAQRTLLAKIAIAPELDVVCAFPPASWQVAIVCVCVVRLSRQAPSSPPASSNSTRPDTDL